MSAGDRFARTAILLFDVDGVLTDNGWYVGPDGQSFKRFDIRDGAGIKLVQAAGFEVALVSGHTSPSTKSRATELGIKECHVGVKDKLAVALSILSARGLTLEQALFMGDDFIDLPLLRRVGTAATVAEAPERVRSVCHWISRAPGGHGAVRELIEDLLAERGLLDGLLERFG